MQAGVRASASLRTESGLGVGDRPFVPLGEQAALAEPGECVVAMPADAAGMEPSCVVAAGSAVMCRSRLRRWSLWSAVKLSMDGWRSALTTFLTPWLSEMARRTLATPESHLPPACAQHEHRILPHAVCLPASEVVVYGVVRRKVVRQGPPAAALARAVGTTVNWDRKRLMTL